MKTIKLYLFFFCAVLLLHSCSPSATYNIASGVDLSKYKYVVWPTEINGDRDLDYVMFEAYNAMCETRLKVISEDHLKYYPLRETLISHCHASQNSRQSLVSIDFKDGLTDLPVLYVKGTFGMGWSVNEDMKGALKALRKNLLKAFPVE